MSQRVLENQENINVPNSKRIKISDAPGIPKVAGRTVLGALSTIGNVRIQPKRAAKQVGKYERPYPRLVEQKKTLAATVASYTKPQTQPFLFGATSSGLSSTHTSLSTTGTVSSGFTIFNDSSASCSSSTGAAAFNTHRGGLRPPSSFTVLSQSSTTSENSNDGVYLSSLATLPALPVVPVSNSTTLSNRIKHSLEVSETGMPTTSSASARQSDYFKPTLTLPINFSTETTSKEEINESAAPEKPIITSVAKVSHLLSSRKLTKSTDFSLHEEVILNRRADSIWADSLYATETYAHLRREELKHKPKPNYIQKQAEITANMRWILIDWLVDVACEYNLHSQTLFLAVSYVDRFLSFMSVKRDKLQLVGTSAILIAAKYEEIYPPEADKLAYITDSTYRISQILKMEQLILRVLNFDVSNPTTLEFTDNFAKMCNSDQKTTHLCQFIAELSMLECEPFLRYLPSTIAGASLALANYTLERPIWPQALQQQSGYELSDLTECYIHLNRSFCHIHEYKTHAIREKYRASSLSCVADILPRMGYPWA